MIEKIDIKDASIAEVVRSQMAVATDNKKGLMSTNDYKFASSIILENSSGIPNKLFIISKLTKGGFSGIIEFYGVRSETTLPSSIRLYIVNYQTGDGAGTYRCYRQGSNLLKIYKGNGAIYITGETDWIFLSARILRKAISEPILQDVTGIVDISSLTEVVCVE